MRLSVVYFSSAFTFQVWLYFKRVSAYDTVKVRIIIWNHTFTWCFNQSGRHRNFIRHFTYNKPFVNLNKSFYDELIYIFTQNAWKYRRKSTLQRREYYAPKPWSSCQENIYFIYIYKENTAMKTWKSLEWNVNSIQKELFKTFCKKIYVWSYWKIFRTNKHLKFFVDYMRLSDSLFYLLRRTIACQ